MPYTMATLPKGVKDNLPIGAQRIWLRVFNRVYDKTKDDDRARIAAWSAVKMKYYKGADGKWHKKK